jgi:hypothetical protein
VLFLRGIVIQMGNNLDRETVGPPSFRSLFRST